MVLPIRYRSLGLLAAVFLLTIPACEEAHPDPARTTATAEDRLMVIALVNAQTRPSPTDEGKLRAAVTKMVEQDPEFLGRFHIASVDEIFTSPRDGQPFGLRFNVPPGTPGVDTDVIAYELQGVNGKRFVAFSSANVTEVDAAKFQELTKE